VAVSYHAIDGCATIAIDRPEVRNAINPEVALGLEAGLDRAEADDGVRVVVITGTPPAFCAGADLKAVGEGLGPALSTARGGFAGIVRYERTKPLIAAVDGPALAGGTEIVLACDLVVASKSARFGLPEVTRGLLASGGGLFRLARSLPRAVALQCALTGDPISAELAHHHGMVNLLSEPGGALADALELAQRITANAPVAVRETRAVMLECAGQPESVGWERSALANAIVMASEDSSEGVAAFIEKRPAVWTGR